jgi:hypothetical protein
MELNLNDSQTFHLDKPITFVIGANGYGKSTRLKTIRQPLLQNRKQVLDFDVTDKNRLLKTQVDSNQYPYIKPDTVLFDIDMHANYDRHVLLAFAIDGNSDIEFKEVTSTSEAYMSFILLKLLRKRLEFLEDLQYDGQVLVLLDGIDSGTTPDVATSYAKYLQQIITNSKLDLKIVATSNTFEFLNPVEYNDPTYLDARTLDKLTISNHQEFVDFVMNTSSAKDVIVY